MNLYMFLVALGFLSYACSESACTNFRTCGQCIGYSVEKCVWCSADTVSTRRCQPETYERSDWCNDYVINPNASLIPVKNDDFSDTIQFRPQEIHIKARPGVEVPFTVSYKPAKDFPIDVYFLMDYTMTMKKHKEALADNAIKIFTGLRNITKNVRLGLGSFVEKPGLPYTDIKLGQSRASTFINHLSLTNNTMLFREKVINATEFGTNYDDPEAGLDALMQVMKCDSQLDWRKKTRKVIVLATDNTYHSAGDGKMVGAVKPNDMKCHMENNEYRSASLIYDYPSVSQINRAAHDGNFLILFAGLPKVKYVYGNLSNQIKGSRFELLKEEDNILKMIYDFFKTQIDTAKINVEADINAFQVDIRQKCDETNERDNNNCTISPANKVVTVPIIIKSKKCLKSKTKIPINPEGLEGLIVTFEVDCKCGCESNDKDFQRSKCNGHGSVECGACKCDDQWGGRTCEFNCNDDADIKMKEFCRLGQNSTYECNNKGHCTCGQCDCNDGYTGRFCEYSPDSCLKGKNAKICAGRGSCEYGQCQCFGQWRGPTCECPADDISSQQCTGPFSKKECSGNGQCKCGECICNEVGSTNFSGAFCEYCDECATMRCKELENYTICNYNRTKEVCNEQFNITTDLNVDVLVANRSYLKELEEWKRGTQCRTELDDGTFLLFKYAPDSTIKTKLLLRIQKELEYPPEPELLVPIASAILGILIIGILTAILWKVLINMYDKREYNKFCDQAKAQGFTIDNPLYQPPTQNFVNPGFNESLH